MTPQEVFDKAVGGCIQQGEASVDAYNSCLYRSHNGLKCAAGHLIPDEIYDPNMEDLTIKDVVENFVVPSYISENLEMISELQVAHDMGLADHDMDEFKWSCKEVAETYGLEWNY